MVSYKKLGLVNTKKMFAKAVKGGYAIPAFNFNTMEQMQAIVQAAVETKSPVIMQVSKGARKYANPTILRYMAEGAVAYAKELGCKKPQIVLHLDHGDSFETCKSCIDTGFSSVMIDGSSLPFKENIKLTKKVVNYAHKHPPPLAFDVLKAIEKKLPGFPIVLHGSSSVPQDEVDTINKYGGKLPDAVGIPEEQLRKAAKSAVCKINIDSDSRLAMTAAIRKHLAENPGHFDPRQYLTPARENMKKMYVHKIMKVLGSNNKL